MIKITTVIAITTLLIVGLSVSSCCSPGDNACYKYWYGLEPHPTQPGRYIGPWDKLLNPELRDPCDPGAWDWLFGIKK